ncbi:hypothetical protein KC335_g168 [Hortaea werneckii]|nr:hypothetical protein KC335_g168 [Hortaea werneckii]
MRTKPRFANASASQSLLGEGWARWPLDLQYEVYYQSQQLILNDRYFDSQHTDLFDMFHALIPCIERRSLGRGP